MPFKRFLLIPVLLLLFFLAIYSLNRSSGTLDSMTSSTGLELVGVVLKSIRLIQDSVGGVWQDYVSTVENRQTNQILHRRLEEAEAQQIVMAEERAELVRLRKLLELPSPPEWQRLACRVLGFRMGPNAVLQSVLINRGFLTGARPGMTVMSVQGLVGRVYRAGLSTATVLLLTDLGSRVAVVGQESRAQGIFGGLGSEQPLELRFMSSNVAFKQGELLMTSGMDEAFPKGIALARVVYSATDKVQAELLVDSAMLEEVLLLAPQAVTAPVILSDPLLNPSASVVAEPAPTE